MYRKAVIIVGTLLLITSLALPINTTKQEQIGITDPDKNYNYHGLARLTRSEPKPIYKDVIVIDTYKTGVRSIAIILITGVVFYLLPAKRMEE